MVKLFPTQEVGSLAKPGWRIKGYQGTPLTKVELAEAIEWGIRLRINNVKQLVKLLNQKKNSANRRQTILNWSAKYALRFFETAGLDIIFGGEQWRSEMYEHVIKNVTGFKFLGYVKSFDYRYFKKAACIDKPAYAKSFYLKEFLFAKENTKKELKIPFTGPYTLADWTFNEYYEKRSSKKIMNFKRKKFEAKREFLFDLIKEVVRPEIKQLVDSGANWIQIDEPAATTTPTTEEMELFVTAFNETVRGFNCTFSLHNCYSNYTLLARHAHKLQKCCQIALEFANRDNRQTGLGDVRTGYNVIQRFEDLGFTGNYGLGVIDVHVDFIEPPQLIRDRILHVTKLIDNPNRIYVNPDCGLRTRKWTISFQKLKNMVLGAKQARKTLE